MMGRLDSGRKKSFSKTCTFSAALFFSKSNYKVYVVVLLNEVLTS
jgi:hypothetical protein